MKHTIERAYNLPNKITEPMILIDRLWPRGITKESLPLTYWAKDWTPSAELRTWFHKNRKEHFTSFQKKYRAELEKNKKSIKNSLTPYSNKNITFVTGVADITHSHIPTLITFLEEL